MDLRLWKHPKKPFFPQEVHVEHLTLLQSIKLPTDYYKLKQLPKFCQEGDLSNHKQCDIGPQG